MDANLDKYALKDILETLEEPIQVTNAHAVLGVLEARVEYIKIICKIRLKK